jgi:hypothetical protein
LSGSQLSPESPASICWLASEPSMLAMSWSWRISTPNGRRVLPDEYCT